MVFIGSAWRQAAPWLLATLLLWPGTLAAQPPTSTRYVLDATLYPESHTLHASARIAYRNPGPPVQEVWLQLFGNALRDSRSVFQRGRTLAPDQRGHTQIRSLRIDGRPVEHAQPSALPGDLTQLRLPLTTPLAADATLVVEIDFDTKLPRLRSRTGYDGDFFLVAQWFPKLAQRDEEGEWDPHPFDAMAEFRSDFAHYDVTLHAPRGYQLEGPGLRSKATPGGVRFQLAPAIDFAWVACRGCQTLEARQGATALRALVAPGSEEAARRQMATLRGGLAYFEATLGPYPYDALVMVVPPRATRVAGMEYPGLIVTPPGPSLLRSVPWLDGRHVAAHELAHQWFHALVSSDEVRHPLLDEALTEWAACDLLSHGPASVQWSAGRDFDAFEGMRTATVVAGSPPPPAGRPAYSYDAHSYGRAVYARAALALESLRRAHGDTRFRQALRAYVDGARFAHGSLEQLANAFDAAYGPSFFAQHVEPLLLHGAASEVHLSAVETRATAAGFQTRVHAHRSGSAALPTWMALLGADDRPITRIPWPAGREALEVDVHTPSPVHTVRVDPDRALLLDRERRDHERRLQPSTQASWTRWLFLWAQALWASWGP